TSRRPPASALFPYPTLFRSLAVVDLDPARPGARPRESQVEGLFARQHRDAFGPRQQDVVPHEQGLVLVDVARERVEEGPNLLVRSEEHTSELQSRENLVCRL